MANNNNNQKKTLTPADKAINAVLALVVVAVLALAVWAVTPKVKEGWKRMQPMPDITIVSGRAEFLDMSVADFKAEFGLGDDVTGSTSMDEAFPEDTTLAMPVKKWAKLNGMTYEQAVSQLGVADPSKITEDTVMEEVQNFMSLGNYFGGEENFNQAKLTYGFDDTVTVDTLYGDVKDLIDRKDAENMATAIRTQAEAAAKASVAPDETAEAAVETTSAPEVAETSDSAEPTEAVETTETVEATEAPQATDAVTE